MKIIIITAYYAPVNVPRAFRATELAREFARRGHNVTVINTTTLIDDKGNALVEKESNNLNLINLGVIKLQNPQSNSKKNVRNSKWKNWLKSKTFYFTTNKFLYLYIKLNKYLNFNEKYDLLISIGLPFAIHWGVSSKIKGRNIADCYVADYGDPFSKYNTAIKVAKYFQWIEKSCMKKYDYISIPTEKAITSYLWLKPQERIKVIPQGFNFSNTRRARYVKNKIPTFAYAGLFYSDIRNPSIFFEYLCVCDFDFHFIVYTNLGVSDSFNCLEPYIDRLKSKLEIRNIIPRENLIYELSTVDFIINVNNTTANQIPSKLVDYTLSERPIFSFSQENFDKDRFCRFCSSDFDDKDAIDISIFDITHVASLYEQLCKLST